MIHFDYFESITILTTPKTNKYNKSKYVVRFRLFDNRSLVTRTRVCACARGKLFVSKFNPVSSVPMDLVEETGNVSSPPRVSGKSSTTSSCFGEDPRGVRVRVTLSGRLGSRGSGGDS